MTTEDRVGYYKKYKKEKKDRNVLAGGENCQAIYTMDNPGYTDTFYGNYIQHKCERCGAKGVPMVCFDNSCDEYDPVSLCANCLAIIAVALRGEK